MSALHGKLIALDVDGTLLRRDGSLADRTVRAVGAAKEAGAVVTLATGRDWNAVGSILERIPAVEYSLCINGIEVFRADGHELQATQLSGDVARAAVQVLRELIPGVAIGAGVGGQLVGEPLIKSSMSAIALTTVEVPDILEVVGQGVRDLVIYHPDHVDDLDHLHAICVSALPDHGLDVAFTGLPMIELVPPGAGKHAGLAWLADHLDIPQHDVVAFGDNLNDLAMLRWAGHGVAMGQADEAIRAAADEVTLASDHDGIAHWLERHL